MSKELIQPQVDRFWHRMHVFARLNNKPVEEVSQQFFEKHPEVFQKDNSFKDGEFYIGELSIGSMAKLLEYLDEHIFNLN